MILLSWRKIALSVVLALGVMLTLVLSGCALPHHEPPYEDQQGESSTPRTLDDPQLGDEFWMQPLDIQAPMVIRTEGYGVLLAREDLSPIQQRLLAMQASRLDAYRAMTEQVHGLYVNSVSEMNQMGLTSDHLRAWFDHLLMGARVIAVREVSEGVFETQIELLIDPQQGILLD